jgi:hypothetical protein
VPFIGPRFCAIMLGLHRGVFRPPSRNGSQRILRLDRRRCGTDWSGRSRPQITLYIPVIDESNGKTGPSRVRTFATTRLTYLPHRDDPDDQRHASDDGITFAEARDEYDAFFDAYNDRAMAARANEW